MFIVGIAIVIAFEIVHIKIVVGHLFAVAPRFDACIGQLHRTQMAIQSIVRTFGGQN